MDNNQVQSRPYRLMISLSIVVIIFGIITICAPSIFWKFMDVILGFFLFSSGISAIINAFKNKNGQFTWLLGIGGFLLSLVGFTLIFSYSQLVGTIIIWIFAFWALIRGIMLIIFGINNKQQPLWWGILGLGALLFILALIIAFSDKGEARTLAGICIGISTLFDGISLLAMSLKIKNSNSLQTQLLNQVNQNEISQGAISIETASIDIQQSASINQIDNEQKSLEQ